ncbi:MAG: FtsX-like permease family protein [Ekhidna sp.]|nr:FtsX-like permease family protein [Ekhidna sp.]
MKEIGIKKAMGVTRRSLILQFFTETLLLSAFSIILAILLGYALLEPFSQVTGKILEIPFSPAIIGFSILILILTTILSGSYPALYLSGFEPISILKGKLRGTIGDLWARKGLVILQYCASAILITSVWVVSSQVKYVQNKNLGFDKEQVIYFNADGNLEQSSPAFIDELKTIPGVASAAGFSHDLLGGMGKTTGLNWEGKDPDSRIRFGNLEVGYELIETFGMEMVAGRSFSKEWGDNSTKIILNEKAIEVMGLSDPIGKTIELWGGKREIIGIVKNFHFESLHEEIKPCFLQVYPDNSTVVVRINPGSGLETIERIETLYHSYNPSLSFNFQFFDQEYNALYKSEQQIATLSSSFAGIAILISCLGLFGLVAFTAERKQKEIGIRKVLGASVIRLVMLLSSDFTKTILAAIIISLPVSYLLMDRWLESFVYRIDLSIWFFIGSGMAAFGIALITMSLQTVKAASANPVKSLKDE